MKKILLMTVTLIMSAVTVMAQPPRFGFNAGISLANIAYKDEGGKEKADGRVGLNIGLMVDIPIGNNLSFQPGVSFVQKGSKQKEVEGTLTAETSMRINYLEVPLNLLYKAPVSKGHIFIGAGPSFGYALNGKAAFKLTDGTEVAKEEENLEFGNKDEDDMKPFELAANILAGYEFKSGFQIAVNYNRSLNNLLPGDVGSASLRNSYFGFKIGYMFNRKNK